jgi:hypothetical protein
MKVSSTSTMPESRSLPARISTDLNRCSIAHAVWYEPISRVRWRLSADTPSFWVANSQHAMNHTVSGVRVRSKIVPAVTDERPPHPAHQTRPQPPAAVVAAARAHEALWPPQPLEVVQAVGVGREPRHQLTPSRWGSACQPSDR